MTRPAGSNPASRTSRNSLTDRSLVNSVRWPCWPRSWSNRSWACGGIATGASGALGFCASVIGAFPLVRSIVISLLDFQLFARRGTRNPIAEIEHGEHPWSFRRRFAAHHRGTEQQHLEPERGVSLVVAPVHV